MIWKTSALDPVIASAEPGERWLYCYPDDAFANYWRGAHLMMYFRDRNTRGQSRTGWLDSRHSFSFADYLDPEHMGFRALRVINEDRVIPGAGFPTHAHRDMEIVSYVISGALEHKDSLGTGSVIRPGEVQRMSAGTGIRHSEFNHSKTEPLHFLQIWIIPASTGLAPSYEQKRFDTAQERNSFLLVGAPEGADVSESDDAVEAARNLVTIHQDVRLYVADADAGRTLAHPIAVGRYAWLQVVRGIVEIGGGELREGDGVGFAEERSIEVTARSDAELMLFDLA
jgi:redox-sensitive bicupin YhaK (pirin superfamily)